MTEMYNMILFGANYRTKIERAESIECICMLAITKYTYAFLKTLFLSAVFVKLRASLRCYNARGRSVSIVVLLRPRASSPYQRRLDTVPRSLSTKKRK